jgi:Fe-only nitrogenase accessory protein AnfO
MGVSEIAVITGADGCSVPLAGPGTILIFRRTHGIWQCIRSFPFSPEKEKGLSGLRQKTAELVESLGECRTLVAKSAAGIALFELGKARCHVWEVAGKPEEFLDVVSLKVKECEDPGAFTLPVSADAGLPAPRETEPGKFTLSITEIQRKRSGVSSKQVLQQFIRRAGFTELEIICEHVPPWIGVEVEFLGIQIETGPSNPHEVRVLLKKPK